MIEGVHSFGLCLLVFRVLPSCDVIRAALLMNCLCIVPGFCKIIFSKNGAGPVGKALIVMVDFLALVAQATVFFVISGTEYTAFIEKSLYVSTPAPNTGSDTKPVDIADPFSGSIFTFFVTFIIFFCLNKVSINKFLNYIILIYIFNCEFNQFNLISESSRQLGNEPTEKAVWKGSWEAPFALMFTSIIWWENYVDRDIKFGCINMPLASYKRHLQSVRSKVNIGASLWKIALTISFSLIMLPSKKFENAFVKLPASYIESTSVTTSMPGGAGGAGGDIDFGGFDNADMEAQGSAAALLGGGGHKLNKRDALLTTTMTMISNAMNLESVLTVPNNAWNAPTTPNLFDFIAVKVSHKLEIQEKYQ